MSCVFKAVYMAQEVGTNMERSKVLQRPVPAAAHTGIMRRKFATRDSLASYLAGQFPAAAARDAAISPLHGGDRAARELLQKLDPRQYAITRNFLDGHVTKLSPYIRHGVLSLDLVRRHALKQVPAHMQAVKFVSELAWRDYWQRLYFQLGDGIWEDREPYKTGLKAADYSTELPTDVTTSATGLACMDSFSLELIRTGYIHNHARMWMAAYLVHWRRIRWQAGAKWFLTHLLDGDPASNNLSWQWVASTFSQKPYFFNRENLERYTHGVYCGSCTRRMECPFEGTYGALEGRLFQIENAA